MRTIDKDALAQLEAELRAGPVPLERAAELAGSVRSAQRWIGVLESRGLDVVRRRLPGRHVAFQVLKTG